jgi:Cys-tRNA(Pro)/Cys-tRNA(Cys) deacylase
MAQKTNAIRIIESLGIPFETASYEAGEEHADAVAVAGRLGVEPETVFKTLVARSEKGEILVFCIPLELDLKKAARAAGVKKVELIGLKELHPLTGYVRGGCSPVGMKKEYRTWIDETALLHERIYVNAGSRGLQMILAAAELARACAAGFADLS